WLSRGGDGQTTRVGPSAPSFLGGMYFHARKSDQRAGRHRRPFDHRRSSPRSACVFAAQSRLFDQRAEVFLRPYFEQIAGRQPSSRGRPSRIANPLRRTMVLFAVLAVPACRSASSGGEPEGPRRGRLAAETAVSTTSAALLAGVPVRGANEPLEY